MGLSYMASAENTMIKRWTLSEILDLFNLPFFDLVSKSRQVYEKNWDTNQIQVAQLMNVKTGGCPEKCAYCPQSAHYNTFVKKQPMDTAEDVYKAAKAAKESGVSRFCVAMAWRGPTDKDLDKAIDMIKAIKSLDMQACCTMGLLKDGQAEKLKAAGLDFYNHNIDTSEEYYDSIISTRTFQDRIDTLCKVDAAGINTCSGGIIGMGESVEDRAKMLLSLYQLPKPPLSVSLNWLIRFEGTELQDRPPPDKIEFLRVIAVARIMFPKSYVRLTGGRIELSEEMQAFAFYIGVNSIHYGMKVLMSDNRAPWDDESLLEKLNLRRMSVEEALDYAA